MGEQLVPGVPPVPLAPGGTDDVPHAVDPTEPARRLLRDLRTGRRGLSGREARRLDVVGPNELPRRRGEPWWCELVRQVSHPLALLLVEEGERVSADARLLDGAVDVDRSALTGESLPVGRYSSAQDSHVPLLHARELLFTGTTCVAGTATGVVYATGALTELGFHRAGS